MNNFKEKLAIGQAGESLISKWLQSRGHSIFPAYEINISHGKGPQMFSDGGELVLPDLLSFNKGEVQWFEAKHKTCFTWHRKTRRWTTGIDLRHYLEYQEVQKATQKPVWLLFYHPNPKPDKRDLPYCVGESPTGLFGGLISELSNSENHRSPPYNPNNEFKGHGHSGMVYWSHEKLRLFTSAPLPPI